MTVHERFFTQDLNTQDLVQPSTFGLRAEDANILRDLNKTSDTQLQQHGLRPDVDLLQMFRDEKQQEAHPTGEAHVFKTPEETEIKFESGERIVIDKDKNVTVFNADGSKSETDITEVNKTDPPYYTWRLPNGATVEKHGSEINVEFKNGANVSLVNGEVESIETKYARTVSGAQIDPLAETPHPDRGYRGEPIRGEQATAKPDGSCGGDSPVIASGGSAHAGKVGPCDTGPVKEGRIGRDRESDASHAKPEGIGACDGNGHDGGHEKSEARTEAEARDRAERERVGKTLLKYFDEMDQEHWYNFGHKDGQLSQGEILDFLMSDKGQQLSAQEQQDLFRAYREYHLIAGASDSHDPGLMMINYLRPPEQISKLDIQAWQEQPPFPYNEFWDYIQKHPEIFRRPIRDDILL